MCSVFNEVSQAPIIEAAALSEQCAHDTFPKKVNLTLGGILILTWLFVLVYRNFEGKPTRLPVVKKMEIQMANDDSLCKDYLPIIGRPSFCESGIRLMLGENHPAYVSKAVRFRGILFIISP